MSVRHTGGAFPQQSLDGLRVAVTRPAPLGGEDRLVRLLLEGGADPIHLPLIRVEPIDDPLPLHLAVQRLAGFSWIVVTSPRTVAPLLQSLAAVGGAGALAAAGVRVCAVGPATSEELRANGVPVDLIPEDFHADAAVEALLASGIASDRRKVLLPRALKGREAIPQGLGDAGVEVEVVPVYRTLPDPVAADRLAGIVARAGVDVLTFTSGSAVRAFAAAFRAPWPEGLTVASLGPSATEALDAAGLPVHLRAGIHTLEGLVAVLEGWAASRQYSDESG